MATSHFDVARTPAEVAAALETFLALEASGWKAKRGTALVQDDGRCGLYPPRHLGACRTASARS